VKYELGFYIPEDDILHRHRRENLKSYMKVFGGFTYQLTRSTRDIHVQYSDISDTDHAGCPFLVQ
jgi:hypothetical protein